MSPQCCAVCPYRIICESNDINVNECDEMDFDDPDFSNLVYKHNHGEDYWSEMSWRKYVDTSLDYIPDTGDTKDNNDAN
jgi:hypothetical protein